MNLLKENVNSQDQMRLFGKNGLVEDMQKEIIS